MNILHGIWIPEETTDFIQKGRFYLWVETDYVSKQKKSDQNENAHPCHLSGDKLSSFFKDCLNIGVTPNQLGTATLVLPTQSEKPLSSLAETTDSSEAVTLKPWHVACYNLSPIIKGLLDIYLVASQNAEYVILGNDFLFWHHYAHFLRQIFYKDHYIPALIYHELMPTPKTKIKHLEINYGWQLVSEQYETYLQLAVEMMPFACIAGNVSKNVCYDKVSILRHFSEVLLHHVVHSTRFPQTVSNRWSDTLLDNCLLAHAAVYIKGVNNSQEGEEIYRQWFNWRQKLVGNFEGSGFHLCFQLKEAPTSNINQWSIDFLVSAKNDPSFKVTLADYWVMGEKAKKLIQKTFGNQFEKNLLINLGTAARMYPKIWAGLETAEPTGLRITLDEAFAFLKESAWILESAGFKIIIPAWWTPEGRQRLKIQLRSRGPQKSAGGANKNALTLSKIIEYDYVLAINGEPLTEQEWQQLVDAKTPLVRLRGQWIELDRDKMQKMLEFWEKQGQETTQLTVQELLRKIAEEQDTFEVSQEDALADILTRLRDDARLIPIENPPQLRATLREYQKRGVSWLQYLEQLGLNGCLADDMGLGKTMQVITHLLIEKVQTQQTLLNLLIVPTSVIGNWQKEVEKFSPNLQVMVHHGSQRLQEAAAFEKAVAEHDIVITSYTLARKDEKLLKSVNWHRIVLDEAQNIKNPETAQTKAILKLTGNHRLALTGTPVENRLMDLWSIFNFLNPNYLGKKTYFRNHFELPIQRTNDTAKATILKSLIEPFILRRLKTDKRIIQDLPDKVENKQYCNLTKEQASLYEAVVKEVNTTIETTEGIERQGLILSTLTRLKQICNHPMQFLRDGSEFTAQRSHKLERLTEMLEEVLSEQQSALIFTQFTEIGDRLEKYFKQQRCKTYYLHGGTPRPKRESMITEFQDPDTEPAIFILSVKAGGVGITLTKANHVFHFDRWWNPAVEDQATDRAFRIGQEKNVFVHKFVTIGTLEERIDQLIEDKKNIANSIVGSDESWLTKLDNQRFKELIALNQQAILES
ncbi:MAG: ATP-dependent helicase [Beggiatoa sp. IS2]|nr:MAG: ATP-dependent helicase [Beggiatoa sp. IS2]